MIQKIVIENFTNSAGRILDIELSYQKFGLQSGAPVILVNHPLTGDSRVTGESGWWNSVVGPGKSIDTLTFTVLAFNIPGNGFGANEERILEHYREFRLRDIAKLQILALKVLGIGQLFAIVGGSIGGALAWELAALEPGLALHVIPIASDLKATQWLRAHCRVQDQILSNSRDPVRDARMHAMTLYRTPASLSQKFDPSMLPSGTGIDDWLFHHGKKLEQRFRLASYKFMNHLLSTVDISDGNGDHLEYARRIKGDIHLVPIDSDWFFLAEENWDTYVELSLLKERTFIHQIKSIHGHDAFLLEHSQISQIIKSIFNPKTSQNEKNEHRALWSW